MLRCDKAPRGINPKMGGARRNDDLVARGMDGLHGIDSSPSRTHLFHCRFFIWNAPRARSISPAWSKWYATRHWSDTMLIGTRSICPTLEGVGEMLENVTRVLRHLGPKLRDDWGWRSLQVPSWPHLIRSSALTAVVIFWIYVGQNQSLLMHVGPDEPDDRLISAKYQSCAPGEVRFGHSLTFNDQEQMLSECPSRPRAFLDLIIIAESIKTNIVTNSQAI